MGWNYCRNSDGEHRLDFDALIPRRRCEDGGWRAGLRPRMTLVGLFASAAIGWWQDEMPNGPEIFTVSLSEWIAAG